MGTVGATLGGELGAERCDRAGESGIVAFAEMAVLVACMEAEVTEALSFATITGSLKLLTAEMSCPCRELSDGISTASMEKNVW